MSGESALRLLVKCMAVLADVSVCDLHMVRPTPETQNSEKNKSGAQNGGFDAFGGRQCLKFCNRSCFVAHLAVWECSIWRFWRFQLGPTLGFQGGWVPQTKPIPLLVPLDPRTTVAA